jgi:thioredoxin 2
VCVSESVQIACAGCLTGNRVPVQRMAEDPKCGKCGAALLDGVPAELGDAQFETFVARTELPVLADFWAPWCGPCRAMAPHFERAAQQMKDSVRLVKVNTEEAPRLAARYDIRSIPTLILFRNGVEQKRMSGALDAGALARWAA